MSKLHSIVNFVLTIILMHGTAFGALSLEKPGKAPVIITSETLTADNKNSTAVFEGSVVAKTDDITMYADKMTVYYDNSQKKVKKIHCIGNVKVNKDESALFSDEALYLEDEKKIIFSGNPKAVDGGNVISGKQIIFHLTDERVEVEGSRVILQNTKGLD